jgi:branched-chain amino acid aminotransferase
VEVVERTIWPEELESFEQCFLTGSAAEVTPVAQVGPWNFEVGDFSLQLRRDYLDLVNRRISNA